MQENPRETFQELIQSFDNCMLVTTSLNGEVRARPMRVAKVESDAEMWFVSSIDSPKADEIATDASVGVVMQGDNRYVSMSGQATVRRDRDLVEELWNPAWKVWFPRGKDDPSLGLIHFVPNSGEFWDSSGAKGWTYLFEAGRAYLKGEQPEVGEEHHGKVSL